MKKGFTLIELLAVIVILAIIAVIAVPIVLNIINDSKESAVLRSADFYLDGVETAIATSTLKGISIDDDTYNILETGNICLEYDDNNTTCLKQLEVEMDGEVPTEGTIKIKNGQIQKVEFNLSTKEIWIDPVTGELAYKLAPGLYDKDDKLLMSWEELVEKYEFKDKVEFDNDYDTVRHQGDVGDAGAIINSIDGASKLVIGEDISIGVYAFYRTKIDSLIILDTVTSIGDYAFMFCTNLTTVVIGDGIASIGSSAFSGCTSLTSITIPDSVTSIGSSAFSGCTSLTTITIPDSVTSIGSSAFRRCPIKEITIPDSVTSIGSSAFKDCKSLTSITIPEGITSIESSIFEGCTSLTTITIPSSVTSIGSDAFAESGLESITIPSSVTSIGVLAFSGCSSLTTINYKGTEEGWNAISKGNYWDSETPTDKVIIYNYKG